MAYGYIVSKRLKELRKKRGLTQEQVANGIGVSRSAVANWETGVREPDAVELSGICEFFCVSSDYMCGLSDDCTTINIPKVYNIDLNKLNALGKQTLFEYFNFMSQNELYMK